LSNMLRAVILITLISFVHSDESSCISSCSTTSMPQCGTWLSSERISEAAGTYELGQGVVNISCVFSSLPRPATVTWYHRPPSSSSWSPFTCSTKDEHISCSTSTEQKVSSVCILRTSALNMTGSYRCEAKTDNGDSTHTKAMSSEVPIHVVGIESVRIVDKSLRAGYDGYVQAEVCAHPEPEIWWTTGEGLVKPGQALSNFASSHMAKSIVRSSAEGPARVVPYCFQLRLIVRNVRKGESLSLLVRSHGEVSTTRIVSSSASLVLFVPLVALLLRLF
ncbi:hypothetical protein PFISCL1PPCAC_3247, partial [Pristionchus fissidentatus]